VKDVIDLCCDKSKDACDDVKNQKLFTLNPSPYGAVDGMCVSETLGDFPHVAECEVSGVC
jgi:hypothetical protein